MLHTLRRVGWDSGMRVDAQVIYNLRISKLEARDESSVDVVGCFHQRNTRIHTTKLPAEYVAARDSVSMPSARMHPHRNLLCNPPAEAGKCVGQVGQQYAYWLRRLHSVGLVYDTDPNKVTKYALVQLQQRLNTVRSMHMHPHSLSVKSG